MKKLLFIMLIIISSGLTANAMEEFCTKDKVYFGLFKFFDKPNIVLIDEFGTIVKINQDSLVSRKRVFNDVYTNKGAVYKLSLIEASDNNLIFVDEEENELIISRDDFDYLLLNDRKIEQNNWRAIADKREIPIPDKVLEPEKPDDRKSYTNFGLAIGTPGVLNLVIGYDFRNNYGVRISGGGISKRTKGIQTDLMYSIKNTNVLCSHLYIGVGYLEIEDKIYNSDYDNSYHNYSEYLYATVGADFNYKGFYANIGLSAGAGDFNSPQIMFGIGYIFRFED